MIASQRVKKVLMDFFARFTNATFFVKLHFTKNRALLVKKPDLSAFLMAIYPIRGGLPPPRAPPSFVGDYAFIYSFSTDWEAIILIASVLIYCHSHSSL